MQTLAATEDERGSSTAEFAVMLPALVFVLALVLGAAATGIVQLKLEEGARLGARAAARGETAETVTRIVQEIDPAATVTLAQDDDMTVVTVSRQAPGVVGKVSGWTLTADAQALTEYSANTGGADS
ncbi:TadE family type IV pilus minor pilin [Rothia sp. SD9660Na]|uniref:TadE family type IV pilus minor pilin n=1 Tax=Rothia sp. SD9660Na TaxID=3047030 RepID=UPI0024B8BF93|nr:TadE family type IV pilus minor pilin [Rothia sp. SD9660Na]WHS50813.1 TadE family type IV pilus minor pilin [Rothia sp. SD9660Na]